MSVKYRSYLLVFNAQPTGTVISRRCEAQKEKHLLHFYITEETDDPWRTMLRTPVTSQTGGVGTTCADLPGTSWGSSRRGRCAPGRPEPGPPGAWTCDDPPPRTPDPCARTCTHIKNTLL